MLAHLTAGQRDGRRRRQGHHVGSFMTRGIPWLLSLGLQNFQRVGENYSPISSR